MPVYHHLGDIPRKRHTVFRQPNGTLYYEELMGNKGFVGPSSLLYHVYRPTEVREVRVVKQLEWQSEADRKLCHRHFRTHALAAAGPSPTVHRTPLLFNNDVALSLARPSRDDDFFYRNAQGDEIVYIAEGSGVMESQFGDLPFQTGDYVVIPRGILHRYRLTRPGIFLIIESSGEVRTPKRYRNDYGQLTEMAPYSERDFRVPQSLPLHRERGEHRVAVKK
ncbi:MAG TPA: hypothetical protein VFL57_06390, partial [Bryobacteraceae bacterium]|nr:hypothetical protein [Bryobacteraceae bacterium]